MSERLSRVEFVIEDCPPLRIEIPYTAGVDLHNLLDACESRDDVRRQIVWTPYLDDLMGALCDNFHGPKPPSDQPLSAPPSEREESEK